MPGLLAALILLVASGVRGDTTSFERIALGELARFIDGELGGPVPGVHVDGPGASLELRGVTVSVATEPAASFTAVAETSILDGLTATLMMQLVRLDGVPRTILTLRPVAPTLGDLVQGAAGPAAGIELPAAVFTLVPGLGLAAGPQLSVPSGALTEAARALYRPVLGPGEFTLELGQGVNVHSRWPLGSLPGHALGRLGIDPTAEIVVVGYLGLDLAGLTGLPDAGSGGLYLKGTLPTPDTPSGSFPEWLANIRMTDLTLELSYDDWGGLVRIGTLFTADLDGRERAFVGSTVVPLGAGAATLELSAALEDSWERPFGVDWLTLDEVGLLLTLDAAGGAGGRFHGFFELGGSRVSTSIELAATSEAAAVRFAGRVDRVSTGAVRDLLRRRAANPSLRAEFPSGIDELRDVALSFSADSEAAFSLSGTARTRLRLDGEDRRLVIAARLDLEGGRLQAEFEGRLAEAWKQPFGVGWLRLDDVRVELSAAGGDDPMAGGTLRSSFLLGETRVGLEIEAADVGEGASARFTATADRISLQQLTELVRKQLADAPLSGSRLDLVIRDLQMRFEAGGDGRAFSLAGRTRLNGRDADLLLFTTLADGQRHVVTGFLMEDWSLSDAVPALAGTLVERFELASVALLVTRASGRLEAHELSPEALTFLQKAQGSDEFALDLEPGISLVGALPLPADSPLHGPLDTLGSTANLVLAKGTLPASFLGLEGGGAFSLRAQLPEMSPRLPNGQQPPWFRSGQLAFFIEAGPPGVAAGLEGSLNVTVDDTDMSFIVAGEFGGPPVAIVLSGRLVTDEPWVAPYGIGWLTVRQVGAALSFNPVTQSLGLGFDGDADLGQKSAQVAIGLDLNVVTGVPTNFVFRGASTTPWAVSDLVALQQKMAAAAGRSGRIPTDRIPEISIRPVDAATPIELKFALRDSDQVSQGFAVSGALWAALDQQAPPEMLGEVDCAVGVTGIALFGSVPRELGVGGLSLSQPLIDLEMTPLPPAASFVLTGDVAFPWFTKTIDVELGGQGRIADGLSRAAAAAAAFRDYSQAFRADPVAAVESSLTGERGLLTVAGVPPPDWLAKLVDGLAVMREVSPRADSRALLERALAGTEITIPAGQGLPAGGRSAGGCLATQQLVDGRCWLVPPFAGDELGYRTGCITGDLEAGRCWIVPPSATRTRPKVTLRPGGRRVCPAATVEQGGKCYARPPGPPRAAVPDSPRRVCAGVEEAGRCWKLGRAPRAGTPAGGADPTCPLVAPLYSGGRCWRVPPRPEIQVESIDGICTTASISCSVDGLLDETIAPLVRRAVDELLQPFVSVRKGG